MPCRDRDRDRERTLPAAPRRCGAAAGAASDQFCFSLFRRQGREAMRAGSACPQRESGEQSHTPPSSSSPAVAVVAVGNPKEVQREGASDTLEAVAFPETATCKAASEHHFCSQRGEMLCTGGNLGL